MARRTGRVKPQTWRPFEEICPELAGRVKAWEERMREKAARHAVAYSMSAERVARLYNIRPTVEDPNGLDDWSWLPVTSDVLHIPGDDDDR